MPRLVPRTRLPNLTRASSVIAAQPAALRGVRARDLARAAALKALEPVVRQRLPRRRRLEPLAVARPDARRAVERAEPHADHVRIVRAPTPERRAARGAEHLREALAARAPLAQQLLAGHDAERARSDARLRRGGRARASLAALAVAGARGDERRRDLVTDAAAVAAAGQRKLGHELSVPDVLVVTLP